MRAGAETPSHPFVIILVMQDASTLSFVAAARVLNRVARSRRLHAPSFRSPPRLQGADRSLRRIGTSAIIAVRVRERPLPAVIADMIEGIVAANRLQGVEADRTRAALWAAVEADNGVAYKNVA